MSKDLFHEMRQLELSTQYPTKRDIQHSYKKYAKEVVDSGEVSAYELHAKAVRLKEAVNVFESTIKEHLPSENYDANGINYTFVNGGELPQYKDDPIYSELYDQLKEREALLKVALKSKETIYDSEGVEVPKVSTKPRKSSLTVKF